MANYSLVVNSKFQPFSFDRYLQPYQIYGQNYKEIEEQYTDLSTKAGIWDGLANEQTGPYTYKMYKTYANDLENQASQLASEGLNAVSRKNMLNMRARYSKEIIPIEQAYNQRSKLAEEQRKLRAANPSIMFDRDFSSISLDDLLDNPELSYTSVSGDDLYKKGKEAAISASSRMMNVSPALQGQYWKIRQGYGADAANKFLLNQSNIPELKDAINRIVSQSGVTKENLSRAIDYTISGIMSGISYNESYQANRGYIDPAERERLALAREQFEWSKDRWEDEQLGAELPNGDRVKDVGGGRVRITHPDGKVEIMAAPKSTSVSKGQNKDKKPFSGLQFKMWNNSSATTDFQEGLSNEEWTTKRKGFDTGDEEQISFTDLSNSMQTNLAAKLAEYGLTFDDVEVWRDRDSFSDDHYQIRLKQSESNTSQEPIGFGDL
jgi:hypothetical protein|nr:MAG TPA: hypothetical protein [Crassvirales sp.]